MKKQFLILSLAALLCGQTVAQGRQTTSSQTTGRAAPSTKPQQQAPAGQEQRPPMAPRMGSLDLTDYGIEIEPDERLIVVLAALDAAGWNPLPTGAQPSVFRERMRKDQAALDPALRQRMQDFYNRYKLPDPPPWPDKTRPKPLPPSPAEQAARYVSLAYTLGPAPNFEAPARSDDLPKGLLDVLDFAPLVREFYRKSGMDERLSTYVKMYRAEGDRMRGTTIEMARSVLSYLNTRPVTTIVERVPTSGDAAAAAQDDKKKKREPQKKVTMLREKGRRFRIVPELLAAPGAINFRVISDDYYVITPQGTDPRSSELRRGYIQYIVDPLVLRFGREIAAKKVDIKQILDAERTRTGRDITPDVYLAVARSMVAAADARMNETARLNALQTEISNRLKSATDDTARDRIVTESKERQAAIKDATIAQLAEDYESGAVLSFYFAGQLRGLEQSGFDLASFIPDMLASITPHESNRPLEYAEAVARHQEARQKSQQARANGADGGATVVDENRAALIEKLGKVDDLLRLNDYAGAESRLLALKDEYKTEPRVYYGLGQAARLSAQDAIDEAVQAERLNRALGHYQQAVLLASADTDTALISRAYVARGRILAFLDRREEAIKEFDKAIALRDIKDGAYKEAVAERSKLAGQPQP
ncbi:MAG TPA: hypothetical protein VM934_06455 [Pyrinomonadaceae bacterium]|nr:hypothetical protein [Pyrinomonadaceae bacterium]